jgi:hypothetical protein
MDLFAYVPRNVEQYASGEYTMLDDLGKRQVAYRGCDVADVRHLHMAEAPLVHGMQNKNVYYGAFKGARLVLTLHALCNHDIRLHIRPAGSPLTGFALWQMRR